MTPSGQSVAPLVSYRVVIDPQTGGIGWQWDFTERSVADVLAKVADLARDADMMVPGPGPLLVKVDRR